PVRLHRRPLLPRHVGVPTPCPSWRARLTSSHRFRHAPPASFCPHVALGSTNLHFKHAFAVVYARELASLGSIVTSSARPLACPQIACHHFLSVATVSKNAVTPLPFIAPMLPL